MRVFCPVCSSESLVPIDVAFDVATAKETPTGSTVECQNCVYQFIPCTLCGKETHSGDLCKACLSLPPTEFGRALADNYAAAYRAAIQDWLDS